MTTRSLTLLWMRLDLRLTDNPALTAAISRGGSVVPLYIFAPEEESPWSPGAASNWWLHQSLENFHAQLRDLGSKLIIRRGPSLDTLRNLIKETGASAVFWNRRYEPSVIARDSRIKETLRAEGTSVESFNAALFIEPWTIANQSGKPFQVFTPYWKACLKNLDPVAPGPAPVRIPSPERWPSSMAPRELELLPKINWHEGMRRAWRPGETGARFALDQFLHGAFPAYLTRRDIPSVHGTSRLSPHLHFGEISPRQIWHALKAGATRSGLAPESWRSSQFITELGWREFSHHLLYQFPHTHNQPLRPEFKNFPWTKNADWLRAWQKGQTGFPIVDAGMRELWTTGWMHNRVRMIVASFLVKDLLISWEEGAKWFWDTLVDADLAQNTLGWQWTAGCGADAAPFFRIFNPISQGEKFDADGSYVRQWCPELRNLGDDWIHCPHEAPVDVLDRAGITLGKTYPRPIVSHAIARNVALEAYAATRAFPKPRTKV